MHLIVLCIQFRTNSPGLSKMNQHFQFFHITSISSFSCSVRPAPSQGADFQIRSIHEAGCAVYVAATERGIAWVARPRDRQLSGGRNPDSGGVAVHNTAQGLGFARSCSHRGWLPRKVLESAGNVRDFRASCGATPNRPLRFFGIQPTTDFSTLAALLLPRYRGCAHQQFVAPLSF